MKAPPGLPCPVCGAPPAPGERCCSSEHGTTWHKRLERARYKAAKRGATAWERVDHLLVFERDGWTCQACHVYAPGRLIGSNKPNEPTLDHVVPVSRGGTHTYANARLLCRRCNELKADALDEELLDP